MGRAFSFIETANRVIITILLLVTRANVRTLAYLNVTFPPIILYAGNPLIFVALAKGLSQFGQIQI